ncbi:disease resistance protein RUN1-like [Malus domestica]|uniref:disease resistance protein RUN1-like n=1 Tax=Malus domestica TaxID=3750 RepID=UPI0039769672
MTAHEASSSSSSNSKLWKYDVFLSFRGEDTRYGFTSHLHAALKARGYQVFIDEDDLQRGEEIKEKLFRAIEESMISVIIFSKMYANSSWCLDELVKIMACRDKLGRHVLPIFYHVDPSHVRKQDGDLAEAFQKHKKDIREEKDDKKREAKQERVKQWREALTKAANLSGHHHKIANNGGEAEFIKKIINDNICEWLTSTNELHVAKHIVGINSRVQDIISYLSSGGSNDVLMVGIWGMGGLGKTTAAKAIYNQIHPQFEFKSFLADVRDATSKHDLVDVQKKLISDILKKKREISCVDDGIDLIKQQFRHRKILVIVDNVDKKEQLDAIVGSRHWFGPGSRIIITTRNERLLLNVNKKFQAQKMNEKEALELFSWHAFKNICPDQGYLEVSKKVVSYCGGLPLALEVLGSLLIKRSLAEWESQLEELGRYPDENIVNRLRISFDGLRPSEKTIFLDISCFFIGEDKDYVAKILDRCGFSATIGISVLRERCLITVEQNKLNMHDLLREMARVIVSEKSLGHPGKWSRLWNCKEAAKVLRNKSGTEEVEGLALNFPYPWPRSSRMPSFSTEAFANMKKLRFLHLKYVQLNGEYKHLPKELIWLCWEGCPLKSIPDDFFDQQRLVVLDMQSSKLVQVWEGYKLLKRLKILNLSHSLSLIKSPDFSQVPYLEELILENCGSLSEIHPSIGQLKRLSLVNLKECEKLRSLPRDFYKLKYVKTLLLNDCLEFREVHEDLGEMISLRILEAEHTAIREIPSSTVRLKNLTLLSLNGVKLAHDAIPHDLGSLISLQVLDLRGNDFHILPSLSGLTKLETLRLNDCFNLHTIPDLPTNLKFLYAANCPALETVPNFSEMSNMRELKVNDSSKLTEVPGLDKSLKFMTLIDMSNCTNLTPDFGRNILQGWTSCGFGGILLYGNFIPHWFDFVGNGNKVSFDIPPNDGRTFEGLTMCFLHRSAFESNFEFGITVINNTKRTKLQAYFGSGYWDKSSNSNLLHVLWQGQLSNDKLKLQSGDKVEVIVLRLSRKSDYYRSPMITMVNLVWNKPMKENTHDLDQASYVFYHQPARFYEESSDNSEPSNDYDLSNSIGSTKAVYAHGPLSLAHSRFSSSSNTFPAGHHIQPQTRPENFDLNNSIGSTVAVYAHGPLSLEHSHFSSSSNTFPAGHHIQPQTRPENLSVLYPMDGDPCRHIKPQTRPENLPVLFQPQSPAVSGRGDQIADPMVEEPLTSLSLSFDHWKPQGPAVSDKGDQIANPMDKDPLTSLSLSLDHWKSQGPAVSDRGDQISGPMGEDFARLPLSLHHWKPQGSAVSDRGDQISNPMDEDPFFTYLSLDHLSFTCSGHHIQPQTRPENLQVLFQPQGPTVGDRGDQISGPMEVDLLARLSLTLHHWKPKSPAISDRGDQIADPMVEDPLTSLSLSLDHWKPQGPAVSDKGDQIADPMDKDPLTSLSLSLDHWKSQGPAVSDRGDQISGPMEEYIFARPSDRGDQISDPMDEDTLTCLSVS